MARFTLPIHTALGHIYAAQTGKVKAALVIYVCFLYRFLNDYCQCVHYV